MNKLFGLFLLALAFLAPVSADAACSGGACFWIGGTGTIDGTLDIGHWSTTTGGTTCACVPATTDTATFDANSGTGTVTLAMGGGTWTIATLTLSNFNGTFDNSVNNNNVAMTSGLTNSSSVTRTFRMGTGNTYSMSSSGANWNFGTTANLTLTGTSTISYTNTSAGAKRFQCGTAGGQFGTVTVAASGTLQLQSAGCNITTLTVTAPNRIIFAGGNTYTIGTVTNISGSGSSPTLFSSDAPQNGAATITSANNWTCDFCGIAGLTFNGGGTFAATNSYNFGQNSNITITAPSAGGGGGRIIGG